ARRRAGRYGSGGGVRGLGRGRRDRRGRGRRRRRRGRLFLSLGLGELGVDGSTSSPQLVEGVGLCLTGGFQLGLLLAERTGRDLHLLVDVLVVRVDAVDQVRASRCVERVVAVDERRQLRTRRGVRK